MSDSSKQHFTLPPEQRAIRDKCFHPTGRFVEFPIEDVERSIPERFERIVRQYPDRIAVKTRDHQCTYDELNKRANRLAHYILTRRGPAQEPVALFLDHWVPLMVAHLAALKAGKFSLGLDPAADRTRTVHLLDDSCAGVVIADSETRETARELASEKSEVIDLDDIMPSLSDADPRIHIPPDAYSYIRYTSGSTGNAKGATKTHRHVLKAVMDFANHFHLCPDDRVMLLGFASLGKHAFEALLTGARLCPFDARKEGLIHLADWLRREKITVYYSFPTAFRYFVSALSGSETFSDLRLIEFEGEPVFRSDVELYKRHFSSRCLMVNTLSSAETGTVSLYFLDKNTPLNSDRVPVGYPVEGVDVLVLDDAGSPVDYDQVGEVAVRSRFLASGYWRKPDVTSQRFVPQTDGKTETDYLYLSGDLGRLSQDGCLQLLGRKDFQVKIRGFRVDLTEVETVLAGHPQLKHVVVIGQNTQAGNTQIVAYVVPQSDPGPAVPSLRAFLKHKLPDYMIPSTFVFLDALPLMNTGKVDRRALPDTGNRRPELDTFHVPPRTSIEKALSQIWAVTLGIDAVGIHDNFFDLGGHSLAATRVISQVIQTFQLELPLKALFDSPTVAEMAVVITQRGEKKASPKDIERILAEVEAISEEEAERGLARSTK
jgi:amino acid adenylation domain-containing protein